MTALEVRTPVDRLTLVARLERLARRVQAVVDDRSLVAPFAQAVLGQLQPAVADAAVQADELDMLRAQAADRERARDGLQSARRDLQNMADLIGGLDQGALSKTWLGEPPMPEFMRDRYGHVIGERGRATRERLLDTVSGLVGQVPWRQLSAIDVAREAGKSPATFYLYFAEVEDAVIALAVRLDTAGGRFSERLRMILGLLEFEGWELPGFSNNTTIEEW